MTRHNGFYQKSSVRVSWETLLPRHFVLMEATSGMIVLVAFDLLFCIKEVRNVAGKFDR